MSEKKFRYVCHYPMIYTHVISTLIRKLDTLSHLNLLIVRQQKRKVSIKLKKELVEEEEEEK